MTSGGTELASTAEAGGLPQADSGTFRRAQPQAGDWWVPLLFMGSGAAGLVYQVVWTRELVLLFGNTTQAIVTTVTAFLAGLGLGSLAGGRLARRLGRPLAVYGALEITVACLALLMPLAFDLISTIFRHPYLSLPAGEVALIRFALTFCALAPVTLLMGMTLPILTRHLVRTKPHIGDRIARLYGLNTAGAVVGALVSGYLLIGLLGLRDTTLVAVTLNVSAGVGALAIASRRRGRLAPADGASEQAAPGRARRPGERITSPQLVLLGVTFTSGLVSLALEVLWTRVFLQATGSAIYIFAAVLGVFLAGIAVGSLVYERVTAQGRPPRMTTLGACLLGAAALTLLPVVYSNHRGPPGLSAAIALIFPVTAIFGYAFPLTVQLFVEDAERASRGVGLVYAWNAAGCGLGAVLAGFVLAPTLGVNRSIVALCLLLAAGGIALIVAFARRRRVERGGLGLAVVGALAATFALPAVTHTYTQNQIARSHRPTAHFEDDVASIDVVGGRARTRRLFVNGVGITSLTIDTKLLAYLPKALRPTAKSALVICFGMGSTFRSSLILGMRTDAVELDPTVPSVMHWFYPDANTYLHSPLAHVIIGDGRNYVRLSNKRYDLITIDAPPPVTSAGTVVLHTREFDEEAKQRLNPGGVVVSFLPWGAGVYDLKLFLRTFRASFRYMMVIPGPRPFGYAEIGSDAPLAFNKRTIERVFGSKAAQADLATAPDYPRVPAAAWPAIIKQHLWLQNDQVNTTAGPGPLLTDNHPLSEYYLVHS